MSTGQKFNQHLKQVFKVTLVNQFSYSYIQIPCLNMFYQQLRNTHIQYMNTSSLILASIYPES